VYAEPALAETNFENRYQFLRKGYFCLDKESTADKMVFNRTVTLKDTWAKEVKKN
jgi:glutaminyl-tRNA synthetase